MVLKQIATMPATMKNPRMGGPKKTHAHAKPISDSNPTCDHRCRSSKHRSTPSLACALADVSNVGVVDDDMFVSLLAYKDDKLFDDFIACVFVYYFLA
jgi:hypothetical protein